MEVEVSGDRTRIPHCVEARTNFPFRINAESSKRIQEPQPRIFRFISMAYMSHKLETLRHIEIVTEKVRILVGAFASFLHDGTRFRHFVPSKPRADLFLLAVETTEADLVRISAEGCRSSFDSMSANQ
jgi:hypothetical protein